LIGDSLAGLGQAADLVIPRVPGLQVARLEFSEQPLLPGVALFVKEVEPAVEELVAVEVVEVQLLGLVGRAFFGELGFEVVFNLGLIGFFEALFGQGAGLGVEGAAGFELAFKLGV
jgi:hypothetical protein